MSDFRILRQRCETLEKMVEVLQLSPCPVSAPLHDRYQVIKDLSGTYSVNLLCQALKVAKAVTIITSSEMLTRTPRICVKKERDYPNY